MKAFFEIVFERLEQKALDREVLCGPFWGKVLRLRKNFDPAAAWEMLIDNMEWMVNMEVISTKELISHFGPSELAGNGIYCEGESIVNNAVAIGIGTAKIKATGHSRVVLFDRAVCEGHDTTFISAHNKSHAIVNDCVGQGFHNARATVRGYGKFEGWDDSVIAADNYAYIILHDRASSTQSSNVHVLRQ